MNAEIIIANIDYKLAEITKSVLEVSQLEKQLVNLPKEDWDWVSVKRASAISELSDATIYARINSHRLECRRVNSKIFVRLSQLEKINDR